MAFKPDQPLSFNKYAHVGSRSVNFALNLRGITTASEMPQGAEPVDYGRPKPVDASQEEKKLLKPATCNTRECEDAVRTLNMLFLERMEIRVEILQAEKALKQVEEDLEPYLQDLAEVAQRTKSLEASLFASTKNENRLKDKHKEQQEDLNAQSQEIDKKKGEMGKLATKKKPKPKTPPRKSTFDDGGITPHLPPIADVTAVERKYGSMRQSYRMAHQDFKEYGGRFKAPGTKGPRGNPGHYMHAMRHRGGERKTVSLLSTYTPPLTSIPPEELRGLQGHAMQGQNGKQIFFIDQGQRRGINNYDTFMALNFSMSMVHIVDDGLLALTPLGPPMPYLDYVAPKG